MHTMLKRIVDFLKKMIITNQPSADLFARRFDAGDTEADRRQWNGGRHLSTKELQSINND